MRLPGIILAVVLALAALSAQAQEGWYIGGEVGGTFVRDSDIDDPTGILAAVGTEFSFDAGYFVGATVGYAWTNDINNAELLIEGEISYRQADFDEFTILGNLSVDMDGDESVLGFMVNGYYGWGRSKFKPYLVGGIGFARISLNDASVLGIPLADDDDIQFAFQGGAGVGYELNPRLTISLDYRYFATLDPDFIDSTGLEFSAEYSSHNVGLSFRYGF